MAVNLKLLESDRFDQKKNRALKQMCCILQSVLHLLIWCDCNLQKNFNKHYRKLFLEQGTRDQNRHKHRDNLGSKVTNHKMTKFPERSEICLFSLQEALCFYFNIIGSFIKSLTSFVLNINMFIGSFSSFRSGSNSLAALSTSQI